MPRRLLNLTMPALAVGALALGSSGAAIAQESVTPAPAAAEPAPEAAAVPLRSGNGPWSVGFQSSWPAWGVSGSYDVNERVTAQAIVGAFGTLTNFGGRGVYRFSLEPSYSLYGFGTVGMWNYSLASENVVGFGGGGGVDLDWRRILSPDDGSFPPLFSTIDLGFVVANFDHYNFSGFTIGTGLHYRF